MTDIDKLIEIARAATAGPWCDGGSYTPSVFPANSSCAIATDLRKEDAAHIATFNPSALIPLLEELRSLREIVGRLPRTRDGEVVKWPLCFIKADHDCLRWHTAHDGIVELDEREWMKIHEDERPSLDDYAFSTRAAALSQGETK